MPDFNQEAGAVTKFVIQRTVVQLICLMVIFGFPARAQNGGANLRALAVERFMAARTLPHNVEARKLMTASLEEDYLRGKRLSIRVRSGRVVAFDFDSGAIKAPNEKEFSAEVESVWADLNELVFATQYERLKFIKLKEDWLANEIEFIRSVPGRRLLPFNVVSEKRGKQAVAVVKKFMKGVLNRDPQSAMQSLTQDFQSKFRSQEELETFLKGPADPYFSAYELQTLTQKDPKEMEVKLKIYLVSKNKRGSESQEARLVVREGKTDWNIDEFELVK
ncbi:MAG: hypothetical protein L0387_17240 [Acidobacteria bacterium]|nr:hypothetical protein [Acidobacteriota bacterium]MCI0623376.1 hypothetical protein [Acidobacteriota bacterium]MCI0721597.1 hypothetical protein [Acidobacteriota bacterium]